MVEYGPEATRDFVTALQIPEAQVALANLCGDLPSRAEIASMARSGEAASAGLAGGGRVSRGAAARATTTGSFMDRLRTLGADFLDLMEAAGGHTLRDHVSQTPQELIRRCKLSARGKRRDLIEAATTFTNKHTANIAVKENLLHNTEKILKDLFSTSSRADATAVLEHIHAHPIGFGVPRLAQAVKYDLTKSRIIIKKDGTNPLGFRIVSAFPALD